MPVATRFTELFGCRHPIQQAGMGGATSADLAIAVARGGGLGMLSGVYGRDLLERHLDAVPPDSAIGVNFLVPFLDRGAVELAASRAPYVELFWGPPDPELVGSIHAAGAKAGWQVGSTDEARAAVDAGCDVIVAQGIEAGGHVRGSIGLLSLLGQVRGISGGADIVVVAAGGIGTGRALAAALVAGADAARVGTRFLAAEESSAHPAYVDALVRSTAEDTVLTTAFGEGWPDATHRVLRSAVEAGRARGDAQVWRPDWPEVGADGPVEARALYAGQSVGAVMSRQPAADIIAELAGEADRALADLTGH